MWPTLVLYSNVYFIFVFIKGINFIISLPLYTVTTCVKMLLNALSNTNVIENGWGGDSYGTPFIIY